IDLADTLERTPIEGILVQQFPRSGGFHVTATKLNRVSLQQPDLGLGQHDGITLSVLLEAHEAFVAGLNSMPQPNSAHPAGADLRAGQAQLVGHTLWPMGGKREGVVQDLLLNLWGDSIGMRVTRPTLLLHEGGDAADLEGATDFVERVAVV